MARLVASTLFLSFSPQCHAQSYYNDAYDCAFLDDSSWTEAKESWCCSHKHIGCHDIRPPAPLPPAPTPTLGEGEYNCQADRDDWERGWSMEKKEYCCAHDGIACKPYDCDADFDRWQLEWPRGKKAWCCTQTGRGCPRPLTTSIPFDCNAGYPRWEVGWSQVKKDWCCRLEHKACRPYDCHYRLDEAHLKWSEAKKAYCCSHEAIFCASSTTASLPPFDCDAGFLKWEKGWSPGKKEWCCKHHGKGCPTITTTLATTTVSELTEVQVPTVEICPETKSKYKCEDPPPDGFTFFVGITVEEWSSKSTSRRLVGGGVLEDVFRSIVCDFNGHAREDCRVTATQETSGRRLAAASGNTGQSNWWVFLTSQYHNQNSSIGKEMIKHARKAIIESPDFAGKIKTKTGKETTVKETTQPTIYLPSQARFDCAAGFAKWKTGWSDAKKDWCCKHELARSCAFDATTTKTWTTTTTAAQSSVPVAFDCQAGYSKWQKGWSDEKKAFCCEHEGMGCQEFNCGDSTTSDFADWSIPKRKWCCKQSGKYEWPVEQAAWCCQHEEVGCPSKPTYNCSAGLRDAYSGWSAGKKEWCCAHESKGCAPFDCDAGADNWELGWADAKKDWCCQNDGVHCPAGAFQAYAIPHMDHTWSTVLVAVLLIAACAVPVVAFLVYNRRAGLEPPKNGGYSPAPAPRSFLDDIS